RLFSWGDANARLEAGGPRICRARSAALRAALGGRVLMLWRVACEDGCGRIAESLLIPVIVDLTGGPSRWTSESIDNLRRHVEAFAEREAGAQAGPMAGGCVAADTRAVPLADVPAPSGAIARVLAHWPPPAPPPAPAPP